MSLARLSLRSKLLVVICVPLLLFVAFIAYSEYQSTKNSIMEEKRLAVSSHIKIAMSSIQYFYDEFQNGKISEEDAKKQAIEMLLKLRYGKENDDYFFANNYKLETIVHPNPKLMGKNNEDLQDPNGKYLFKEMRELSKSSKSGFVDYIWPDKKDKNKNVPKLSYIDTFEKWEWIVGSGIYVDDVAATAQEKFLHILIQMIVFVVVLIVIIIFFVNKNIVSPILNYSSLLSNGANEVANASTKISDNSAELSQAATEQAASLQETVSSVDEISAMINKNAEAAKMSREISGKSEAATVAGKGTVDKMLSAISDIAESNQEIMMQMDKSNRDISDIVKVISDIGEKTKVINDIVFQTKLLSFNASVEAARAGKHGKGFAVVAEEVGNLATMSGNAAKEISDMLSASIKKVESIVDDTKVKVDRLMDLGKNKVEIGKITAEECQRALEVIAKNVVETNQMVDEIAVASNEQAQGVQEITKAMGQLDQVTQQNTSVAQQASEASSSLKTQADELNSIVSELLKTVSGSLAESKDERHAKYHSGGVSGDRTPKRSIARSSNYKQSKKISAKPASHSASKNDDQVDYSIPSRDDNRFEDV